DVTVLAHHIGVGVMHIIVGMFPLLGRAGVIPVVVSGIQIRIAQPVPLAMHHVVANLHVLQNLGERQQTGSRQPCRRQKAEEQQSPAGYFTAFLEAHHTADIAGVGFATVRHHLLAQSVDFLAESIYLGTGQADTVTLKDDWIVLLLHCVSHCSTPCFCVAYSATSTSPSAAWIQSLTSWLSTVRLSPVCRSRTEPRTGQRQV